MPITLFKSTDVGAPTLTGVAGSVTALLDACLGSGYGSKAGLGWATAFTGTNKRVYRSNNAAAGSNRLYLRVDDSTTVGNVREAYVRGFETMSDVDTGTGPFPTVAQYANGLSWPKSTSADATPRTWCLIGDDRTFYFIVDGGWTLTAHPIMVYGFGHAASFKPGDAFNTFISGSAATNFTTSSGGNATTTPGLQRGTAWGATAPPTANLYFPRAYVQTGGAVAHGVFDGRAGGGSAMGAASAGIVYPNAPDSGLWVAPCFATDHTGAVLNIRARFPGMYVAQHSSFPHANYDLVSGVVGLSGVTLVAIAHQTNTGGNVGEAGMLYFDTTGPW